jgi:hypothetical protein
MNTPTITMEKSKAIATLESYETAAKRNPKARRDIDRGLMDGYRVLARGGRLVDVTEAIKAGGLNLAGIPKLAIARAHALKTLWEPSADWRSTVEFPDGGRFPNGGGIYTWARREQRSTDDRVRWTIPVGTFEGRISAKDASAMVPLIPLPLRPKFKLENYFILWEANWHPEPPRDPYLLRPVAGALMEIIAEWDLTDLEIAAARGAMQSQRR